MKFVQNPLTRYHFRSIEHLSLPKPYWVQCHGHQQNGFRTLTEGRSIVWWYNFDFKKIAKLLSLFYKYADAAKSQMYTDGGKFQQQSLGKYIWERKIKVYCTFSGLQTIWKTWTLKKQTKEWITCINCKNTLKFKFSGSILLIIATVV